MMLKDEAIRSSFVERTLCRAESGVALHYQLADKDRRSRSLLQDQRHFSSDIPISAFEEIVDIYMSKPNANTDLEIVDMLEQFFWGKSHGTSLELGVKNAADRMTRRLNKLAWKQYVLEGDPKSWKELKKLGGVQVLATPVCQYNRTLHYATSKDSSYAGYLEFMSVDYLRTHFYEIFDVTRPPGNIFRIHEWSHFPYVQSVKCKPMSVIIKTAGLSHVNFLLLDAAGAELAILKSFDWDAVQFDVMCIENDPPFRPLGYTEALIDFCKEKNYVPYAGQQGRNIWFVRENFIPSRRKYNLREKVYNVLPVFRGAQISLLSDNSSITTLLLTEQ